MVEIKPALNNFFAFESVNIDGENVLNKKLKI
jgi:hypothetical protein